MRRRRKQQPDTLPEKNEFISFFFKKRTQEPC